MSRYGNRKGANHGEKGCGCDEVSAEAMESGQGELLDDSEAEAIERAELRAAITRQLDWRNLRVPRGPHGGYRDHLRLLQLHALEVDLSAYDPDLHGWIWDI